MKTNNLVGFHSTIQYCEHYFDGNAYSLSNIYYYSINKRVNIKFIRKNGMMVSYESPLCSFGIGFFNDLSFKFTNGEEEGYDVNENEWTFYWKLCRLMLHHMFFILEYQISYVVNFLKNEVHYIDENGVPIEMTIPENVLPLPLHNVKKKVEIYNGNSRYYWGYDNNDIKVYLESKDKNLYLLFDSKYNIALTLDDNNIIVNGEEKGDEFTEIVWKPVGSREIIYNGRFVMNLLLYVLKYSTQNTAVISSEGIIISM